MTTTGAQRVQEYSSKSAMFKYYIHDSSKGYTLEMFGALSETSVVELTGCWKTAESTLRNRRLTLDVRGITALDETARRWLAAMAQDGAQLLPDTFLLDTVAGLHRNPASNASEAKQNFFGRIFRFALRPAR